MEFRVIVSAVIEKDGRVLMGRKPVDMPPYPNTWHIPGGGLDPNETLEEGLKREVYEETGVEITDLERLPFSEDFTESPHGDVIHYIFLVFLTKYKAGEPRAASDLSTLEWIPKEEIPRLAKENALAYPSIGLFKSLGWLE